MSQNDCIKILLIDDDEDDYFITHEYLLDIERQNYNLEWIDNYSDGYERIAQREHDVYLIDYRLGAENGLDLLRQMVEADHPAPIILLTGQGDHKVDVEAMRAGAADYLVKSQLNAQLLERAIRYALERKREQEQRVSLENQLRQSQKMDAIGQMAGGIAHDFNNILTAIISYAGISKHLIADEHPIYERLEGIEDAVKRAANLTRQLLAFASRQSTSSQAVNLNQLTINISRLLRRLISADIELVTDLAMDLAIIQADSGQLEQVLVNLVVNARDAMPDGGTLTIKTSNVNLDEDDARKYLDIVPGDYILLSVTDTGIGMSGELLSHIFEPFFTTKEKDKGTGLGLATCYGIVKQSNGAMIVNSTVGAGSCFDIYLPCTMEDDDKRPLIPQKKRPSTGAETILFAEDEEDVRLLVTDILRQQGYTVLHAQNGEEALALVQNNAEEIDLLLSDVIMPKMGGIELAQAIQELNPSCKILFISGYSEDAQAMRSTANTDILFLKKPFSPTLLAEKVREVLEAE